MRKRKSTVAPRPAGWVMSGSNWPQLPEDLVELLGLLAVSDRRRRPCSACRYSAARSNWRRFSKIDARCVERLLAVARLGIVGDRLVDLDRVELVGQREPLDAGGQPGDRLVVLERVEREDAGVLGPAVFRWTSGSPIPASVCVPNWPSRKLASSDRVALSRPGSISTAWASAQRHRWPSFFASWKLSRNAVVDRRPVGLDGGRRGLTRHAPRLTRPHRSRAGRRAASGSGAARTRRPRGCPSRRWRARGSNARRRAVGVATGEVEPLDQELQGAGPIALVGADVAAAAPMLAAVELAGDDEAEVPGDRSGSSRRPPGATASSPCGSAMTASRKSSISSDRPSWARHWMAFCRSVPDEPGVVLGIESERPVALVGVLEVPLLEERLQPLAAHRRLGPEVTHGRPGQQEQGSQDSDDEHAGFFHGGLEGYGTSRGNSDPWNGTPFTITWRGRNS